MVRRDSHSKRGFAAVASLIVISVTAFMTRLLPLSFSQYPFNNDSLIECGLATKILETGHLDFSAGSPWYASHSGATPALNVLLAFTSSIIGPSPLSCAQVLDAVVAVTTVGCIFVLGRLISGHLKGGVASSLVAILMGTFVFTTGSVWKEMLGISLLAFALLAYVLRNRVEFRILVFMILLLMPLIHHLVALVALLAFAYLTAWSWFFALANGTPRRRYMEDLVMVAAPIIWAVLYYSFIEFDRVSMVSSSAKILLLVVSFVLVCMIAVIILSIRNHLKWTLAPIVGVGLFAIIALDYFGFLFLYTPSASDAYFLLAASSAFLFGLAWYGAEIVLETRPMYRAIPLALIVSPLSIMAFGVLNGFSSSSHQIVYRTIDFIDIFIFLGVGAAFVRLSSRHRKAYGAFGLVTIACLLVSFPFAYDSQDLLGIRHDTQAYEVDAIDWLTGHAVSPILFTDERLGHVAESTVGLLKHNSLPGMIDRNVTIPLLVWCLAEDSWTSKGVNNFPGGKVVFAEDSYALRLAAANVVYVGGPVTDRAVIFTTSVLGAAQTYHYPGYQQID
jgi:hypothetical protein